MASESVSSDPDTKARGSEHNLWIGSGSVLTFYLDRDCRAFPPERKDVQELNKMILGLARASKSVIFHAENDQENDSVFLNGPLEDIANAIVLLSQLSEAVSIALEGEGTRT